MSLVNTQVEYSGLIGTEDFIFKYARDDDENTYEFTPVVLKQNLNSTVTVKTAVAGLIPVTVTLNGAPTSWKYKTIQAALAADDGEISFASQADSDKFTIGTYYLSSLGEYFYCLSKRLDGTTYKGTFRRGLLGSTTAAITASDEIYKLDTILLDSGTTTQGVTTYDTGYGFIVFKEMPRNLAYGQKNYPSYDSMAKRQ